MEDLLRLAKLSEDRNSLNIVETELSKIRNKVVKFSTNEKIIIELILLRIANDRIEKALKIDMD
jgi:hypothetical protein